MEKAKDQSMTFRRNDHSQMPRRHLFLRNVFVIYHRWQEIQNWTRQPKSMNAISNPCFLALNRLSTNHKSLQLNAALSQPSQRKLLVTPLSSFKHVIRFDM